MKMTKRLLSLVLAMAMAVTMAIGAFAAGSGSITIKNATKGEKYSVYKLFDATFSGSGDSEKASYYFDGNSNSALFTAVNAADSPFTVDPATAADRNNIALKTGKTDADVLKWAKAKGKTVGTSAASQTASADGEVTLTGLAKGYYYVESSLGAVVTLTNAKPDATVIDKNEGPGWDKPGDGTDDGKFVKDVKDGDKWVKANSASIGDTLDFGIFAKVPLYAGSKKVTKYTITDTLDTGLELTSDDISVVLKHNGTEVTVTNDIAIVTTTRSGTSGFTVTIEPKANYPQGQGVTAEITYKAKVTNTAVLDNKNKATMTWDVDSSSDPNKDDPNDPKDPDPSETDTYVYGITVDKVDSSDNSPLVAKFKLLDKDGTEVKVSGSAGTYRVDPAGTATITTTGGTAKIFGLAEGSYKLEETEAPDGYAKLTSNVSVDKLKDDSNGATKIAAVNADGYATSKVTVENTSTKPLPSTGGIGTTIFYVVGGLMVVGAAVLLVTKRRASAE